MATDLTPAELWQATQDHGGIRPAARAIGVPESTIRHRLKGFKPDLPDGAYIPAAEELPATHVGEEGVETWDFWDQQQADGHGTRRYIVTSAQNNTYAHTGFLANLKALAKEVDAALLVSYTLYDRQGYRGLTRKGETRLKARDVWWDKRLQPYAVNARCRLHRRLAFCGELDILATAKNPLSSLEAYCGRSSIIVPHNRFAFKCVESRPHQMPKEMLTTGSITTRQFIQRKAGQIAHFHHVLGALLVEVTSDGYWYVHHLNADENGDFYWLDRRVSNGQVEKNHDGVEGVVLGDVHLEKIDEKQDMIAWDMVRELQPKHVLIHDLIDFTSRNHHNREDPLFRVSDEYLSRSVEADLKHAGDWLDVIKCAAPDAEIVVVESNHHDAFTRWIKETDWRDDPANARFYLTTAVEMVKARQDGWRLNPMRWAIQQHHQCAKNVQFLDLDQSYEVAGIECGMHGHVGPSGARGDPKAFSRLGFKSFTAHTHTPSIVDGCYTVGVLGKLNMDYNVGPSKWMHAHGIIYPNGKRAFLFVKNGAYRAE